jgi:7,8-dihydro-6-hydroxymethylpterin-pyrophosphokinase
LRDFCLQPMIELAPLWVHPKLGLTARQMLEKLNQ